MDLLAELEGMVNNVSLDEEISEEDVTRWQTLFQMSPEEAERVIEGFRSDLARSSMSDESWSMVAVNKARLGFDKEAYEYLLTRERAPPAPATNPVKGKYIVKLEGPINNAESIRLALGGAKCPPEVLTSRQEDSADEQSLFCKISAAERGILLNYLIHQDPEFRPTIVRLAMAEKDLGTHSRAPFLGGDIEHMLPHLRPENEVVQRPAQNEYPVWYFFYGKLAEPAILQPLLGLDRVEPTALVPAQIRGGKIKTWGGRYNAMVNATADDVVVGRAFKVASREQEEALQFFETDMYEVVRCDISMEDGKAVAGLVFRYCGPQEQLS